MIELLARHLVSQGIDEIVLALGFQPQPFESAFPGGRCEGCAIRYVVEPEPLDTGGAIGFAARTVGIDDTFLVMNGDVMTDVDVQALVGFHRASSAEGTIHLIGVGDPSAFGVVELSESGRIRNFVEKPPPGTETTNLVNAGTYVLEPSVIGRIPEGRRVSIERDVFPAMVSSGTLYGLHEQCYWLDAGRPDVYLQANLDVLDGLRPAVARLSPAIAGDAAVAATALVRHSIVGARSEVGADALVEDSVLLPGAAVEPGARVRGSVVAGIVGRSASVVDCVIGASGTVPAGGDLTGARIPLPE
jgi:mannose-1-phosphate guanylyltransferase